MINPQYTVRVVLFSQVFFEKTTVPDTQAITIPDELIPPCDLDEEEMSDADCADYAALGDTTYYVCDSILSDYYDTVDLVRGGFLFECVFEGDVDVLIAKVLTQL